MREAAWKGYLILACRGIFLALGGIRECWRDEHRSRHATCTLGGDVSLPSRGTTGRTVTEAPTAVLLERLLLLGGAGRAGSRWIADRDPPMHDRAFNLRPHLLAIGRAIPEQCAECRAGHQHAIWLMRGSPVSRRHADDRT